MHPFVVTEDSESDEATGRLLTVECRGCGTPVRYAGTGRPPRYCSPACRQRGWALRQAEQTLTTGADPRPQVVRETVERRVHAEPTPRSRTPAPGPMSPPATARDWERLLGMLAEQLADTSHRTHREHWHHRRLYRALTQAAQRLEDAHPGGLDQLTTR